MLFFIILYCGIDTDGRRDPDFGMRGPVAVEQYVEGSIRIRRSVMSQEDTNGFVPADVSFAGDPYRTMCRCGDLL